MTEMVERVAKAIAEHGGSNWETCLKAPGQRMAGMYRAMARAAIEAMREPTVEMCRDAAWDDYGPDECQTCWRAMIDAALAP